MCLKSENMFQEISNDDVLRAIKKLKVLGNGFTLIPLRSGRYLVQVSCNSMRLLIFHVL